MPKTVMDNDLRHSYTERWSLRLFLFLAMPSRLAGSQFPNQDQTQVHSSESAES